MSNNGELDRFKIHDPLASTAWLPATLLADIDELSLEIYALERLLTLFDGMTPTLTDCVGAAFTAAVFAFGHGDSRSPIANIAERLKRDGRSADVVRIIITQIDRVSGVMGQHVERANKCGH